MGLIIDLLGKEDQYWVGCIRCVNNDIYLSYLCLYKKGLYQAASIDPFSVWRVNVGWRSHDSTGAVHESSHAMAPYHLLCLSL